jgi:uncharacterized protein
MSTTNKEIVRRIDAAFGDNNLEGFLAFCHDNIVWHMVGDRTVKGKDAIRQWMGSMMGKEPPQFAARTVVAEGDHVMSQGHMTMKDESGAPAQYEYCDIYRFSSGKVADLSSFVIKTSEADARHPDTAPV